jgi:hypothetical protein
VLIALALLVDADPIAVWGLLVGIISAVIALVAAIAAIYAAVYAKAAPTKEDLERVAENTAHLEEVKAKLARMDSRHEQQEYRERVRLLADKVSMSVSGKNASTEPFVLHLKTKDAHVVPMTVELHDDTKALFGSFDVNAGADDGWEAIIDPESMNRWFEARVRQEHFNKGKLRICVVMLMNDLPASRDMPVTLYQVQLGETHRRGWMIEGEV